MEKRMVEFIRALRVAGVRISLAESQDALFGVEKVGLYDPAHFKAALKATLVKEAKDQALFDYFFPLFFSSNTPPMSNIPDDLSPEEQDLMALLVPLTIKDQEAVLADALIQDKQLKSARNFRSLVNSMELQAVISLHLSSNGDGIGAFNEGWLYPLKETINRVSAYSTLDETIRREVVEVERQLGLSSFYKDTLRPSRIRTRGIVKDSILDDGRIRQDIAAQQRRWLHHVPRPGLRWRGRVAQDDGGGLQGCAEPGAETDRRPQRRR